MFCCALATGHCKAFQHIFVNQKKWRKLEITSFTAHISRPSYLLLLCLDKENYRPVNVLQHFSNVFERIMYQQLNDYMTDKLSKQLTGFRKNHSTHHCLSCMLEIWKKVLDKGGYICAIFMDLSKAFDTLNHDLLIAKLRTYGFETVVLRYMKSYLTNRKHRVKVNKTFSE